MKKKKSKKKNFLSIKNELIKKNIVPKKFKIKKDTFFFKWISDCSIKDVLNIRNQPNVLNFFVNDKPISLKEHNQFLMNYDSLDRIDFIIVQEITHKLVGSVYLTKTKIGMEIGKYIGNKDFLGQGIAKKFTNEFILFIIKYFSEINAVFSKTKFNNKKNINLNYSLGFKDQGMNTKGFLIMKKELY